MYHSSTHSAASTHDDIVRHHARQTNEDTIVRLGHEVASLQTTYQGNQDAFEKQMSYLESSTAANEMETHRLQRLLSRSTFQDGAREWVPTGRMAAYREELRVKSDACDEYQRVCNVLLGAIASEIAGGGGGAEAVLGSLKQALEDHGFGANSSLEGGTPGTAAALLATLLPPSS